MAANIRAELRRFQRRKQLQYGSNSDNDSGSGGEQSESPARSEKPVFTFKQVRKMRRTYVNLLGH